MSADLSYVCHRQFIYLYLVPACIVGSGLGCVVLGPIILVVEICT